MPYLIENLEIADNPVVLFRGIVGSRAQDLSICWWTDTIRLPHILGLGMVRRGMHTQSLKRYSGPM